MQLRHARDRYVRWLGVSRNLSGHSIRAYEADIAALERYVGATATLDGLTSVIVYRFVESQRDQGLGPNTIRRRLCGVRGFFKWLEEEGLLDSNPCNELALRIRRRRTLPRPVPGHDLAALLTHLIARADVDRRAVSDAVLERPDESTTLLSVALMVATGLRVGEVVGLKLCDLDVPGRSIRVLGKGARERQVYLPNEWIAQLARAYVRTRAGLRVDHDWLLFNRTGMPLTTAALRARLAKAAAAAGINGRVTPHMLRHSAATQLIESGVDIRYVQRLLGHASLSTTEIYTHVADHALRRVVTEADVLGRTLDDR